MTCGTIYTCPQGTPEWKQIKLGKVSASRIDCVMAKGRGGAPSATRANLMADLITERLTATPVDGFQSEDMRTGTEREPEARAAYAFYTGQEITQVGFIDHGAIAWSGCSPDSLVNEDGLLEVKCPKPATHLRTLLGGELPNDYRLQVMWQMACTGRAWVDWVSYSPAFPEHMRLFIKRVPRDPVMIVSIETEVRAFLGELDAKMAQLEAKFRREAAE